MKVSSVLRFSKSLHSILLGGVAILWGLNNSIVAVADDSEPLVALLRKATPVTVCRTEGEDGFTFGEATGWCANSATDSATVLVQIDPKKIAPEITLRVAASGLRSPDAPRELERASQLIKQVLANSIRQALLKLPVETGSSGSGSQGGGGLDCCPDMRALASTSTAPRVKFLPAARSLTCNEPNPSEVLASAPAVSSMSSSQASSEFPRYSLLAFLSQLGSSTINDSAMFYLFLETTAWDTYSGGDRTLCLASAGLSNPVARAAIGNNCPKGQFAVPLDLILAALPADVFVMMPNVPPLAIPAVRPAPFPVTIPGVGVLPFLIPLFSQQSIPTGESCSVPSCVHDRIANIFAEAKADALAPEAILSEAPKSAVPGLVADATREITLSLRLERRGEQCCQSACQALCTAPQYAVGSDGTLTDEWEVEDSNCDNCKCEDACEESCMHDVRVGSCPRVRGIAQAFRALCPPQRVVPEGPRPELSDDIIDRYWENLFGDKEP